MAAALDVAQALGLVDVGGVGGGEPLGVTRRLDGGRREVLAVTAPAVLSVEGAVARLRRASLPAELAARTAPIEVVPGPTGPVEHGDAVAPYRPAVARRAGTVGHRARSRPAAHRRDRADRRQPASC